MRKGLKYFMDHIAFGVVLNTQVCLEGYRWSKGLSFHLLDAWYISVWLIDSIPQPTAGSWRLFLNPSNGYIVWWLINTRMMGCSGFYLTGDTLESEFYYQFLFSFARGLGSSPCFLFWMQNLRSLTILSSVGLFGKKLKTAWVHCNENKNFVVVPNLPSHVNIHCNGFIQGLVSQEFLICIWLVFTLPSKKLLQDLC